MNSYGIGNATQVVFGLYASEQKDRIQPDQNRHVSEQQEQLHVLEHDDR